MRAIQTAVIVIAVACAAKAGFAQQAVSLRIATFNAGWLFDKPAHERWVAACSAVRWDAANATPQQAKALEGLPYCNVHNGLKFPTQVKCPTLTPEELNTRPLLQDKGCRESKDLIEWAAYEEKRQSLRAMLSRLAADGVTMIALQEVFNTASVREILPPGWDARTSADDPKAPLIPQHVGVAWKVGAHQPGGWDLETRLSNIGDRPLRPGLTFTDSWNGKPVQFMVVHLKASCSSQATPISAPRTAGEKDACPSLEQQVHVLEQWVDSRVHSDFMIIGDFNRRLTFEKKRAPNMGTRPNPKIDQLFPELSDNDPAGSELWLAQPPRVTGPDGKERLADICPNGHPAIDHIVISSALAKRARMANLQAHAITLDGKNPFKAGRQPFAAPPSDHCPHFVEFRL